MQIQVNAQTIRNLHAQGLSVKQISEQTNLPVARIRDFIKQLGLGRVKSRVYVLVDDMPVTQESKPEYALEEARPMLPVTDNLEF